MKASRFVLLLFLSGSTFVFMSAESSSGYGSSKKEVFAWEERTPALSDSTPVFPPVTRYNVIPNESTVVWRGYYVFLFDEHYGTIQLKNGKFILENNELKGGSFELDMGSMKNQDLDEEGKKDLIEHLKSDDFFSVHTYSTSKFEITKIEKIENPPAGKSNYEITGDLTIKGITHSISFPALVSLNNQVLSAKAKLKFDRTRWNIKYNSGRFLEDVGDGVISDGIGIELALTARE